MKQKLSNVRIAFAKLYTPESVGADPKKSYGAVFVIPPKDPIVATLDAALVQVAKEKWADKSASTLKMLIEAGRVCFLHRPKSNSSGEVYGGFEGMFHLNSSRAEDKGRPLVIDQNKSPLTAQDGKPYSGCYVNATIELWAQDNSWGKRINATLQAVQFVRDGDAFSGGSVPSADDFDDIADGATAGDVGADDLA